MKFCRFVPLDRADSNGSPRYGILDEYQVREISGAPWLEWAQSPRAWPLASIIGPGEPIALTPYSQRVEHEGELAIVIGRRCSHLRDSDDALSFVLGYTCLNDVTARDIQKSDVQFTRGKGFDTFCPVGPHIETELDPANVLVETRVNGAVRQSGNTSLMIYPCAFLVRWISRMMTLYPGDVIATGTPAGVGPVLAGDAVEVSVAGIGVLRNPVHAPQAQ